MRLLLRVLGFVAIVLVGFAFVSYIFSYTLEQGLLLFVFMTIILVFGALSAFFPIVGDVMAGFIGYWMIASLLAIVTMGPICLFFYLSWWMLHGVPMYFLIIVLGAWCLLLIGAISLIGTPSSRAFLYNWSGWNNMFGRLGLFMPLIYTFNVVQIAIIFFALATCLLTGQDTSVISLPDASSAATFGGKPLTGGGPHGGGAPWRDLADSQERFSLLLNFFAWHFLDEIPLLSVNKTLHWEEPLTYHGWVGPVLLVFKLTVIGPGIAAFALYAKQK